MQTVADVVDLLRHDLAERGQRDGVLNRVAPLQEVLYYNSLYYNIVQYVTLILI